jgi:hypothetical protein
MKKRSTAILLISFLCGGFDAATNLSRLGSLHFSDRKDTRMQGTFRDAGFSYRHQYVLSSHWSLERTIGLGFARASLSLMYIIR